MKNCIPIVEVKIERVNRVGNKNLGIKGIGKMIKTINKHLFGVFKYWLVPVVMSGLLLYATRPSFAQLNDYDTRLAQYVVANNVNVGVQADEEGITQIYFDYDGTRNVITAERRTSASPVTEREYITWMSEIAGFWQIFLYHIPSKTTTQLTYSGSNTNPRVSDGKVVWEGWEYNPPAGGWQIYLYTGTSILKLTSGDISINPEIEGDYVVYGRKDANGTWRSVGYSISGQSWIDIAVGEKSQYPKLKNKKIQLGLTEGFQEQFSLQIDDLFLLQLGSVPLSNPSQIQTTIDTLQAEIDAMTATASGGL